MRIQVWGHPHDSTSSSIQLSRSPHLCLLASNAALFRAPTSESHSASHACQICQLTNGRAGWPAEIRIKDSSPGCEHSFNALVKYRAHQESSTSRQQEGRDYARLPGHNSSWTRHYIAQQNTTSDCLATMPSGPGTTRFGTVRYLAAHSPATTSAAATAIHRGPMTSQPCIQCMSSPAANQTPLRHTVTLFSDCIQHRWGRPSDTATNLGNRAAVHTTTTVRLFETLINVVICVLL